MKKFAKNIIAVSLTFSLTGVSYAQADELYFPVNGCFSTRYLRGSGDISSLSQYKAEFEDYIEGPEFKESTQKQKEDSTRRLLNEEIKDIGVRVEKLIEDIKAMEETNESNEYLLSDDIWSSVEEKLKSLRVAADVLRDSGHSELESLIVNGLMEKQNLKMFNEDGSLCDEDITETGCPTSKMIFLVDLIEKVPNEKVKDKSMDIIEAFSTFQTVPQNSQTCLIPQNGKSQNQPKDQSIFCGMTKSNKVRKAIRSGLSYFISGNQDPTHTCRAISLYLTKGSKNEVQLDSSRESYVEDSSGKRIKIGPAEFKMLQEAVK